MTDAKHRFAVITNDKLINEDKHERKKELSYHSNPMKWESDSLKEDLMRFNNDEAGKRFSIEDLFKL